MSTASTAAHTPGPWKAGRPDMQTLIEGYGGKYIYADGSKYVAAAIGCEVRQWDEVVANARLISAAPEMLEALELLIAVTPHLQFCEYAETHKVCPDCPRCKGEAAIQKARGQ